MRCNAQPMSDVIHHPSIQCKACVHTANNQLLLLCELVGWLQRRVWTSVFHHSS